jgi:hypothetical protein
MDNMSEYKIDDFPWDEYKDWSTHITLALR